jgi:hypothetical protein
MYPFHLLVINRQDMSIDILCGAPLFSSVLVSCRRSFRMFGLLGTNENSKNPVNLFSVAIVDHSHNFVDIDLNLMISITNHGNGVVIYCRGKKLFVCLLPSRYDFSFLAQRYCNTS